MISISILLKDTLPVLAKSCMKTSSFSRVNGIRDPNCVPEQWQLHPKWREQVDQLQEDVANFVKVDKLDKLVRSMFTAWIKSFPSKCNLGAPKQNL